MHSRRSFVKGITLGGLVVNWRDTMALLNRDIRNSRSINWDKIRQLFPISEWEKTQFNSGSVGVMPTPVRDHLIDLITYVNTKAPYVVWNQWQSIKNDNLSRLGKLIGCSSDSLQIVRNTTEALNMIVYGIPLDAGDEVIICEHEYPFARNAWLNRQKRDGIELKEIEFTLPDSDDQIVAAYANAISSRTKVMHITHITHRQGHIMPVEALTQLAHSRGVQVVIDGAHVVGQIHLDLDKIGCDYYASSLHKWLNAPHGTGLLFVDPSKISSLHNHPSSNLDAFESINKYEHLGTRCWANEIGISSALDFHDLIGSESKLMRLQELKRFWVRQVEDIPKVTFHTNLDDSHSAAVTTFSIDGLSGGQITRKLDKDYDIHAKSVGGRWGGGVRISVNIFTNFEELELLTSAIRGIARG